jgi:hypothetical protein
MKIIRYFYTADAKRGDIGQISMYAKAFEDFKNLIV